MTSQVPSYHGYRFPPEIISHASGSTTGSGSASALVERAFSKLLVREVFALDRSDQLPHRATVADFLAGGDDLVPTLRHWAASYRGSGTGQIEWDALPEPFLGPLTRPRGVFLALNPGRADLAFQGRDGIFAREIRAAGSYSAWAASWPYLRDPWVAAKDTNRHHSSRLRFLRDWVGDRRLPESVMVGFELYPWHSARVTARMCPDQSVIEEFVWRPIVELGAPVFAFGAPWAPILEKDLGLQVVDRLGPGGRRYPTAIACRKVTVLKTDNGVTVIAEQHAGSAGPPSREETAHLRQAVEGWL